MLYYYVSFNVRLFIFLYYIIGVLGCLLFVSGWCFQSYFPMSIYVYVLYLRSKRVRVVLRLFRNIDLLIFFKVLLFLLSFYVYDFRNCLIHWSTVQLEIHGVTEKSWCCYFIHAHIRMSDMIKLYFFSSNLCWRNQHHRQTFWYLY